VGKPRVRRLMRKHGIQARGKRKFRVTTTDSWHGLAVAPNLLDRKFIVAALNQAWVGDFTYIATEEGWLFLAVVVDLFGRKVIGWPMRPDMHRDPVIDALKMAWLGRNPGKRAGPIFHSDHGSRYAGKDFAKVLEHCSITPSMSRKSNCWDNACPEPLFGSLKVERLHGRRFETIREAKDETISWLLWYNQTRMHSTLHYASPMRFEKDWMDATVKIAA
jgi:putative transposase